MDLLVEILSRVFSLILIVVVIWIIYVLAKRKARKYHEELKK